MIGFWLEDNAAKVFWGALLVVILMTVGGC